VTYTHDLIVIGAGAAGLTVAGGAAMFGLTVVLVEAGAMGGDCLNTGCVPSKALLAAAARARDGRVGARLGVDLGPPRIDFGAVRDHVRGAIAAIAPVDSQERFEALGVEVIRGRATIVGDRHVTAAGRDMFAPRLAIATGSRPRVPAIPGLADVAWLTNETIFDLEMLPRHLAILGGGPIAMEMAQAFIRLGAQVTVIARGAYLSRDDPRAGRIVTDALAAEGVNFLAGTGVERVARDGDDIRLTLDGGAGIVASHLLLATGRVANVSGFGLDQAGVACGDDGIIVDSRRRTSNRRVYAVGDCRAGPRFTHMAGHDGSVAAVNIALGWPARAEAAAIPHTMFTDPELAQIGMTEGAARARFGRIDVVTQDFAHNDRAIAEGDTRGFIKLVRHRRRLVGVTIVGRHAGELLLPWTQIIAGKAGIFALASAIVAYPTRSEISKAAAFAAHEADIFGPWPRRWARLIARLRR